MQTTLSLHPRDGVRSFEEPYERVARAAGIDPASKKTVEFDVTSPVSMNAYFDALLHPMEEQGVDFCGLIGDRDQLPSRRIWIRCGC